jgi:hypothetical protein
MAKKNGGAISDGNGNGKKIPKKTNTKSFRIYNTEKPSSM